MYVCLLVTCLTPTEVLNVRANLNEQLFIIQYDSQGNQDMMKSSMTIKIVWTILYLLALKHHTKSQVDVIIYLLCSKRI